MSKPILLYGAIYESTAIDFTEKLSEIPENEAVNIWIDSPGGSLNNGWAMLAALNNRADVNMTVMGDASSMAFFMLLFADKTISYDTSVFLIHRAASFWEEYMNEDELKDINNRNKLIRKKLSARIDEEKFKEVTGKSFDDIFSMDERLDVRLTAAEAKKIGLIDKVIKLNPKQRKEKEAIESHYYNSIAAMATNETNNEPKNKIMGRLTDLFKTKEELLTAQIGNEHVAYTNLEVGESVKVIGENPNPANGSFETETAKVTIVENKITAVDKIDAKAKDIANLRAEMKTIKENSITAKEVADVMKEQLKERDDKIEALESRNNELSGILEAAKLKKSNPVIPQGEFKKEEVIRGNLSMYEKQKQLDEKIRNKRKGA